VRDGFGTSWDGDVGAYYWQMSGHETEPDEVESGRDCGHNTSRSVVGRDDMVNIAHDDMHFRAPSV
jgi:hypothetical protein